MAAATGLCFAALLVTSCHVITTVTLSVGVKVTRSERWLYPCAGSTVADDDVMALSVENEAERADDETKTRRNESVDWNDTLKILTQKTIKLKKRVHDLKKLYVSEII